MSMTWEDLADALAINVRTIQRWRKISGTPQLPDLAAWQAWRGMGTTGDTVASDAALPGHCEYDALVQAGKISYEVAKERESVIGIAIKNEAARVENQKARALLVTRDEAEKAAALVRDRTTQRYDRAIARAIQKLPAEIRADVGRVIEAEVESGE